MIDLFGLDKQADLPPEQGPSPEMLDSAEPPTVRAAQAPVVRGARKLWAFLLMLDSLFVLMFAGALAAKMYQHWEAPAVVLRPGPRRRPPPPVLSPIAPEPAAVVAPVVEESAVGIAKIVATSAAEPVAPIPPRPSPLKVQAMPTEFKIYAPKAKAVELVGAFLVRDRRKAMTRRNDGAWTVAVYLNPGVYRYYFFVDKKKQLDPENPRSAKGYSLLTLGP